MSQPPLYNRLKNFTDYALAHPSAPYNPSDHDAELNGIEQTLDGLTTNIALIQRDDGEVRNETIGPDQLTTSMRALIAIGENAKVEPWTTGHLYNPGDAVSHGVDAYLCVIQHVAGVFNVDLGAGKWVLIGTTTLSVVANASLVAYTPTGTIASTNVQAAVAEVASEAAAALSGAVAGMIPLAQKGAANGVATLDGGGKVPVGQLPDVSGIYVPIGQKAAANGVATLDAGIKVPVAQLPDLSGIYLTPGVAAATYIPLSQKGAPNGVATLDATGMVTPSQLPPSAGPFIPLGQKGVANGVASLDAAGMVPAAQAPRFLDGTIAAPAISWAAETTMGWYRPAAKNAHFVIDGQAIFFANPNGLNVQRQLLLVDGTAALPAMAFNVEPTTGLYRFTANGMAVAISGAAVMSWQSTGVGIVPPVTINATGTAVSVPSGNISCGGVVSGAQGTFTNLNATNNLSVGNASAFNGAVTINSGWLQVIGQQVNANGFIAVAGNAGLTYPANPNCALWNQGIISSGSGAAWPGSFNLWARNGNNSYAPFPFYSFTPINTTVSQGWHSFAGLYTTHGAQPNVSMRILGSLSNTGLCATLAPLYGTADYGGKIEWEYSAASPAQTTWRCAIARNGVVTAGGDISLRYAPTFGTAGLFITSGMTSTLSNVGQTGLVIEGQNGLPVANLTLASYGEPKWIEISTGSGNLYWGIEGGGGAVGGWAYNVNLLGDMACKTIAQMSDASTKHNVRPLGPSLATLLQLQPVRYQNNVDDTEDLGFVAQDTAPVFPEAIHRVKVPQDGSELLAINYSTFVAPMIEAIRELHERVLTLEGGPK